MASFRFGLLPGRCYLLAAVLSLLTSTKWIFHLHPRYRCNAGIRCRASQLQKLPLCIRCARLALWFVMVLCTGGPASLLFRANTTGVGIGALERCNLCPKMLYSFLGCDIEYSLFLKHLNQEVFGAISSSKRRIKLFFLQFLARQIPCEQKVSHCRVRCNTTLPPDEEDFFFRFAHILIIFGNVHRSCPRNSCHITPFRAKHVLLTQVGGWLDFFDYFAFT